MSRDAPFSPLYHIPKPDTFKSWDYKEKEVVIATPKAVDEEAQFSQECERIKAQAREEGFAQGLQEGRDAAKPYEQQLMQRLSELTHPAQQLDQKITEEIVQVILHLCKVCIEIELSLHPEKLMSIWNTVQQQLPLIEEKPTMHLSKESAQWFEENIEASQWTEYLSQVQVDETLNAGDFYLSFTHGDIDGGIAQRLKNVVLAELGSILPDDDDCEDDQQ